MTRGYALDPQARSLLERVARAGVPPFHTLASEEVRRLFRESCRALQPAPPGVSALVDTAFEGPGGRIGARLYRPMGRGEGEALPVTVFFHGGGWTFGDLDTHDCTCRMLANFGGFAVASIDYRLAPENRFPAAVDDAFAAVRWILAEGPALGLDVRRIAVAGDSAGGNLAAAVALLARDAGIALAMQALFYPVLDLRASTPSQSEFARGYLLERETIAWTRSNYLAREADAVDPRASPLLASDHRGLAPAYIVAAGFDPLLDEGAAYADRLASAGVSVIYECFEGMVHGFITMSGVLAAGGHALYRVGYGLRQVFQALR
ncbi:MAG: alpha/beta hydrolase [Betaproteobacteria bacterium]|nr:alpha/beta hydrolase [Betaproteobacteria bacterium]